MTVNLPAQVTRNQYTANGSTDIFNYTFLAFSDIGVKIYVQPVGQNADEVADLKVLNTDYSIQGVGTIAGSTITFLVGKTPANNEIVTIVRDEPQSLASSFSDTTTFNGQSLDDQLERTVGLSQQNKTNVDFQIRYDANTTVPLGGRKLPPLKSGEVWIGTGGNNVGVLDISSLISLLMVP